MLRFIILFYLNNENSFSCRCLVMLCKCGTYDYRNTSRRMFGRLNWQIRKLKKIMKNTNKFYTHMAYNFELFCIRAFRKHNSNMVANEN